MADKIIYPEKEDLEAFLTSTGVVDTSGAAFEALALADKLAAAVDEWEEATGWYPFLGDTADVTRTFDPPGPHVTRNAGLLTLRGGGKRLFLGAGLLSLTSLTIGGQEYDEGTQFWLRPNNADVRNKPFTSVEFIVGVFGQPQSIVITGKWGRCRTLKNNVWQAVLQRAAALCVPQLALQISGGQVERKVGDSTKRFAISGVAGPLAAEFAQWNDYFEAQLPDNTRESI